MRAALVTIQMGTFIGLGLLLLEAGEVRLGVAQLLLAVITGLIYW